MVKIAPALGREFDAAGGRDRCRIEDRLRDQPIESERPLERKVRGLDDHVRDHGLGDVPGPVGLLDEVPAPADPAELPGPRPARKLDLDVDWGVVENPKHGGMEKRPVREFFQELFPPHVDNLTYVLRKRNISPKELHSRIL